MTAFTPREVRKWAAANDVPCSTTGRVPQSAIDAYLAANYGTSAEPPVESGDEVATTETPDYDYDITLDMPICPTHEGEIAQALLDLVDACFRAGQTHERARMLAALGVEA